MADRTPVNMEADVRSLGFYANRGRPRPMPAPHAHTDIEGNYLLSGSMTYLHGGRLYSIRPGDFTIFWAGIPHRLTEVEDGCEIIWLVLPLAWYMQWQLPESLTQRLLSGDMVGSAGEGAGGRNSSAMDRLLLSRWSEDLSRTDPDIRRIVMLEVEARFRRIARELMRGTTQTQQPSADDATGTHAERLAAFMAQHYQQDLSVGTIAQAVDLHPNYAMQLFKKRCGMGMWEYLMQLRISHAQRLLLTTDWKVHRIAMASGFASPSRFYEAFTRIAACTPREYRQRKPD